MIITPRGDSESENTAVDTSDRSDLEDTLFALRQFRPKHPNTKLVSVDALEIYRGELIATIQDICVRAPSLARSIVRSPDQRLAHALAQVLYEEASIRLEIERVDHRLKWSSRLPYQLRSDSDIRAAMASLGADLSLSAASRAGNETWESMTPVVRAWGVNNPVLDTIATNPGYARSIDQRDVTRSVEGDPAAWERLRAACCPDDSLTSSAAASPADSEQGEPGNAPPWSRTMPRAPEPLFSPPSDVTYEEPLRGRFASETRFLHEVGYVVSKIEASGEVASSATVSKAMGERYGDVAFASDRALKRAADRWFGSWPAARKAARKHYRTCTPGPSCVPPEVRN